MRDEIRKWEIVNPDDPDEDNGTKLLNYCIVIGPGQSFTGSKEGLDGTQDDTVLKNGNTGISFEVSCDRGSGESFSEQDVDS
ncbi:hypothetical protein TNCV_5077211 [Trichonephila clavipes]|uniref:Uncharacterized protein n=1 Tax=Trichonephila clavipes TaxID=2585209 RepID=A0A8X6VBB8_TRICX|nr:hypothetical protein TNCV_5077211 [Trichonephila clavipes]